MLWKNKHNLCQPLALECVTKMKLFSIALNSHVTYHGGGVEVRDGIKLNDKVAVTP